MATRSETVGANAAHTMRVFHALFAARAVLWSRSKWN